MENIYDILRRYEFDKTEPETLAELVKEAIDKGEVAQRRLQALGRSARILSDEALAKGLVVRRSLPRVAPFPPVVGIDGSCQQVGGIGGTWYVPISCAIVKALGGDLASVEVDVVAKIETVQQRQFQNVGADVAKMMMAVETKAITVWAQQAPAGSYVLLDGPVIDPPAEVDKTYVNLRAAAVKSCQGKGATVVGCVKRSFDTGFLDHARGELAAGNSKLGDLVCQFPSDNHLLTFLLSAIARSISLPAYLRTKALPLAENKVTKLYAKHGLQVFFTYVQRDVATSLLRVEAAVPPSLEGPEELEQFLEPIAELCVAATYPGHYLPLPVQLAHDKCNIRQGCAEVLYEEIMTRARASDPLEQIVLAKLR